MHVDLATSEAPKTAARLLPAEDKDYKYSRFLHLSNWRAFSPGPQDFPLAVMNSRSVPDDEGMINIAVWQDDPPPEDLANLPPIEENEKVRLGKSFIFPYREGYEWYYFSNMTRDELLTFKLHDSDHSRPWRTPHCAFKNDAPGAKLRESIEIRTCCYFK